MLCSISAAGGNASNNPLLHYLRSLRRAQHDTQGDGGLAQLLAGIDLTKPPKLDDKGTCRAGIKEQKPGAVRLLIQRAVGMATG